MSNAAQFSRFAYAVRLYAPIGYRATTDVACGNITTLLPAPSRRSIQRPSNTLLLTSGLMACPPATIVPFIAVVPCAASCGAGTSWPSQPSPGACDDMAHQTFPGGADSARAKSTAPAGGFAD